MTEPSDGRDLQRKGASDGGGPREGRDERSAPTDSGVGTDTEIDIDPETIPAPLLVVDGSGRISTVNRTLADRLGYEPDDLRGVAVDEVFPDLRVAALAAHAAESEGALATRGVGPAGQLRLAFAVEARAVTDREATGTTGGLRYLCVGHETDESGDDRRLAQYERIVRTIDDGVYVLDDAFNITAVNEAATEMTGYDREELVGSNATMLASEETLAQAATVSDALRSGEGDAATIATTIETADGETVPIETRFSVYPFADGSHGQVGVFRDISDRIRYERALATLNDATRELLGVETEAEVYSLVAETVAEVIDLSAAVAYDFDSETNVLHPVASATATDSGEGAAGDASEGAAVTMGELPVVTATDGDVWRAFVDGERRIDTGGPPVAIGDSTPVPAESAVAVPLGDHGVLWLAMDEADRSDPNTTELIDLVAASAVAALERVDRDRRLRERERELRDRNERLQRLERINEVIRRIDAALVEADSRAAIESAVATHLAESPLFSFAWIGRPEDGELVPTAWAGDHRHYLDSVDRSLSNDGGPPGVRAVRTGEVAPVATIADDLRAEPWRTEAVSRGFGSALGVPLGPVEGVLTVYTDRTDGFPDAVQCALLDLGETAADAVRAVDASVDGSGAESTGVEGSGDESAEAGGDGAGSTRDGGSGTGATDPDDERLARRTEADLRVDAPECPLVRLSGRVGRRLRHEGTVPLGDGHSLTVVRSEGEGEDRTPAATVEAQLAGARAVRSLGEDDAPRYALELVAPTIASTVADAGGWIRTLVVDDTGGDVTVSVPRSTGIERVLTALRGRFGDVTVTGSREAATADGATGAFRAAARSELTDRQWTVLRAAHVSGFFEWPRATTGEEVAATLGVSQPTVSRHLRVGQGNLFDLLFTGESD